MAEDAETAVELPHISYTPVDFKTGLFTPAWYVFFEGLYNRTGADGDLIFNNTTDISGKVDKTTQVIAGDGLDGGGPLSGDVTLDVDIQEALDLTGTTVGSILARGSLAWQLITPGSDGSVLMSNGAGLLPSYEDVGGACLPVVKAPTGLVMSTEACGTVITNEKT